MAMTERVHLGGPRDFVKVHHVMVRGTNFDIGRQLGELARDRYGRSPDHFAADPLFARARRLYFQRNYPIHWLRVQGVASAFGLDPEDNRFDLTGLPYHMELSSEPPTHSPGCSVVYYPPSCTTTGQG